MVERDRHLRGLWHMLGDHCFAKTVRGEGMDCSAAVWQSVAASGERQGVRVVQGSGCV